MFRLTTFAESERFKIMKVAVVGATGLVGQVMLKVLEERGFPVSELLPVASEQSVGKTIVFNGQPFKVVSMEQAIQARPDVALFSAGGSVSKEFAPRFAEVGTIVIDNSSAWRMTDGIPLVVPEVNGDLVTEKDKIIANPNCSTIQMVVALNPLHQKYGIRRIIVSTYQAVTGTGMKAVKQYKEEASGNKPEAMRLLVEAFGPNGTFNLHATQDFEGMRDYAPFREFIRAKG